MEEKNNERPQIIVYGTMNDIHDNTYYGGEHYYGDEQRKKNENKAEKKGINDYSMNELREIVNKVMPMIGNRTSYFFSVIKVFMWKGKIEDHNFDAGIKFLNDLYPHLNFGKKEQYSIAEYDKDCFYKSFDRWKDEDAPVHNNAYKVYWNIANELLKML